MTLVLLVVAAVVAVADWAAVNARLFRLEYVLKPAATALLLATAISGELGTTRVWVLAALALSLAGDIALMRSRQAGVDRFFVAGLGAFLFAHLAYIGAFLRQGVHGVDLVAGALVVLGLAGLNLPAILRGVTRTGRELTPLFLVYSSLLAAMVVVAVGTGVVAIAAGGLAFFVSDTLLARHRFVAVVPRGPLLVMITYHAAQFLLLIGLLRTLT